MFNFYKATSTFVSIQLLADRGHTGDAKALLRKLIDLLINVAYLSQDREVRQWQYWHYYARAVEKSFNVVAKNPNEYSEMIGQAIQEHRDSVARAMEDYRAYWNRDETEEIQRDFRRSWSGTGPAEMAKQCGMGWAYFHPYITCSSSLHASIEDITSYYNFEKGAFGLHFDHDDIPFVLLESCRSYWYLCVVIADVFELAYWRSLRSLWQQWCKLDEEIGMEE